VGANRRCDNHLRICHRPLLDCIARVHEFEGRSTATPGLTTWLGIISTVGGVLLILAGLRRYE